MVRALEMVAPGTALREGLDNILHAHTGGLIVIGDVEDLAFLFSGGIRLDLDYSPALLYELSKMDGAIVLSSSATKIAHANVQLTPDPTIHTLETGTRHRTAERVAKQTDAIVVAISERREVVSLYVDAMKYMLEDIPVVLAKANQGLATLDKYRSRLDQVSTRLTALEFEGGVPVRRQAQFRSYASPAASFEDYARLLAENPRYAGALGKGDDVLGFARGLIHGSYATDPAYANKIVAIADSPVMRQALAALKNTVNLPTTAE